MKLKVGKNNEEDRMNFVNYWADYIKSHPQEWAIQHNQFINAMMENAKHYPLTAEEYLKMKGEKYKVNHNFLKT